MIKAYWCSNDNYGDALTPYLIKKISDQDVQWSEPTSLNVNLVTGSLLGDSLKSGTIWGIGSAFESDITGNFCKPNPNLNVIATRGPLTFQKVKAIGHQPLAYGDPGLLLPRFYQPNITKKHKIGIIPSWIDYHLAIKQYKLPIINVFEPIEYVIDHILECEMVIAGCLHGLITAVAYGIPTVWVKFSNLVAGDGLKFRDFLSSIEYPLYDAIDLQQSCSVDKLLELPKMHNLNIDLDRLYNSCPFRK